MQCLAPIEIKNSRFGLPGEYSHNLVPCGRCYACLKRRQSDWSFRLKKELKRAENAFFVTLTYSDDNYPIKIEEATGEVLEGVNREDVQLFLKRLRRNLQLENLKYYIAAEYGDRTKRPHYHGIFFNVVPKCKENFTQFILC